MMQGGVGGSREGRIQVIGQEGLVEGGAKPLRMLFAVNWDKSDCFLPASFLP